MTNLIPTAEALKQKAAPVWVVDADGNIIAAGYSVSTGASATSNTESDAPAVAMERTSETETVTINNGGVLSNPFRIDRQAGYGLQTPDTLTACSIGFYVSVCEDGPFQPFYNHGNNASPDVDTPVQIGNSSKNVTAGRSYPFPAETFPFAWAMLWSQDGSGNNVPQGGSRDFVIVKKS